jgi:cell fate (sporulation/competence/biofilm development) regulator YlbF (YheA/YmcA/DUF963 family)
MEAIIALAERLGRAINESSQAASLRAARKALNAEPALSQLLKDYQAQADRVAQLERDQKAIEVDDKHKLDELQTRLLASEVFKKFTAAQVEYVDLMRKVNEALRNRLAETEED